MTTTIALDSSAVLTWVLQERGWQGVDRIVRREDSRCLLPGPVLTEVVHTARRKGNTSSPEQLRDTLLVHGCLVVPPEPEDLLRAAALLEVSDAHPGPAHPISGRPTSLSLADATILAVVERRAVKVLTRDQHWSWFQQEGHTDARVVTF